MALHINLLHEEQTARKQRSQDPLKIGILTLLVLSLLLCLFYLVRSRQYAGLKRDLNALQSEWELKEPQMLEAEELEKKLSELVENRDELAREIETRFLWASFLAEILKATSKEVQFSEFNGSTMDGGNKVLATLVGRTVGHEPRKVAEDLRRQIVERLEEVYDRVGAQFESLDEIEKVSLSGSSIPAAAFKIQLRITVDEPAEEEGDDDGESSSEKEN